MGTKQQCKTILGNCNKLLKKLVSRTKKCKSDTIELAHVLRFVLECVTEWLKLKEKYRPPVPNEGETILRIFNLIEGFVHQIVEKNQFQRVFCGTHFRGSIDKWTAQLFHEFQPVWKSIIKLNPKDIKLENPLKSEYSQEFWENNFGKDLFVFHKDLFEALKKFADLDIDDAELLSRLRYVLDPYDSGSVSVFRFSDFLHIFGPASICIEKFKLLTTADGFCGYISSLEAEKVLMKQPVGTFLVRFSNNKCSLLALAYTDLKSVVHIPVDYSSRGYQIDRKIYPNLPAVIQDYSHVLKNPYESDLLSTTSFHGEMTSSDAEELLGDKEGHYLFRFSSQTGYLALSYVTQGKVKHSVLEMGTHGYNYESRHYKKLEEIIQELSNVLRVPLKRLVLHHKNTTVIRNGISALKSNQKEATQYSSFPQELPFNDIRNDTNYTTLDSDQITINKRQYLELYADEPGDSGNYTYIPSEPKKELPYICAPTEIARKPDNLAEYATLNITT